MAFPLAARPYISIDGGNWLSSSDIDYGVGGNGTSTYWFVNADRYTWWKQRYEFDHWEFRGTVPDMLGSVRSIYMRSKPKGGDQSLGIMEFCACFKTKETPVKMYHVTTASLPQQAGTLTGDGDYFAGDTVILTAVAKQGYRFVKWFLSNGLSSTSSTYTFSMPAINVTAVAYFRSRTNLILRLP